VLSGWCAIAPCANGSRSEGDSTEERKRVIEGIVKEELGRKVEIMEVKERRGRAGMVLITSMERVREKKDLLERGWEIRRNWGWE